MLLAYYMGVLYNCIQREEQCPPVRIIAKKTLRDFWQLHADAEGPLRAWHYQASREQWESPDRIRELYPRASIVGKDRVVFRLKGGAYRLVVSVFYPGGIVYVRFIGTHADYDRIKAVEV